MTAGPQFHSVNLAVGIFCGGIMGTEEPNKTEMVLLTKDIDQSREVAAGFFA